MPELDDPLTSTLDALRSDVERTPLLDSRAVRRRGDRRTRRQAVGGALVVVAVVAGAVGVIGGVTGEDRSAPPAGHGTATTTVSPSPTPTGSTPASGELPESVLLTPVDLPVVEGLEKPWQSVDPATVTGEQTTDRCLMAYDGAAFEQVLQARFTAAGAAQSGQAGVQWVYRAANEPGARNVFTEIVDWAQSCKDRARPTEQQPPSVWQSQDWSTGHTQQHYLEIALDAPNRSDVGLVQRVMVGQVGTAVTVLVLEDYAQDGSDPAFSKPVAQLMVSRLVDPEGAAG